MLAGTGRMGEARSGRCEDGRPASSSGPEERVPKAGPSDDTAGAGCDIGYILKNNKNPRKRKPPTQSLTLARRSKGTRGKGEKVAVCATEARMVPEAKSHANTPPRWERGTGQVHASIVQCSEARKPRCCSVKMVRAPLLRRWGCMSYSVRKKVCDPDDTGVAASGAIRTVPVSQCRVLYG